MKKVLITGVTGFAGSHLAQFLVQKNEFELTGTYLTEKSIENVSAWKDKIDLKQVDLTQRDPVFSLIQSTRPDVVYHLAAFPSPKESYDDPAGYIHNNIDAELHLLEALRKEDLQNTRVLIVSSADVYGLIKQEDLPIDENTPLRPTNPYAISKIAQDYMGLQYVLSYGLDIVRVRPFNHLGPRLSDQFAPSAFAKQIAEIEKGKREPVLEVGNLSAKRDYTDVQDMVEAYSLAVEKGEKGEVYNLGSGKSYIIEDILNKLLSLSTVKDIRIERDHESLQRPIDIPELVCDNTKFRTLTGWSPATSIDQTLTSMLNYWRAVV